MDYRKDYYKILDVSLTASKEEIRASFRRLAKLYHPDKNAGNADTEEKFKELNEANEILSNDILKNEYDEYRKEQERWETAEENKKKEQDNIKEANRKSYIKTTTVATETRVYIRGEITVKYWADCEGSAAASFNTDRDYKINPTEAHLKISEQNIYPVQEIPLDYLRAFKESDLFTMPIPQPIRCEVEAEKSKEYFELTLKDIRIKNIKLDGVTKHEDKSYGTLTGQFYGYSPKLTYKEVFETVTECFGETGNVERKSEAGFNYIRKEFYHPDCSTYWGNWIRLPKPAASGNTYKAAGKQPAWASANSLSNGAGCGLLAWIVTLLVILLISPKLFIFSLVLVAIGLVLYFGETIFSSVSKILSFAVIALLFLFFLMGAKSLSDNGNTYIKDQRKTSSAKKSRSIRQASPEKDSLLTTSDTLISHFIQWKDYAGKLYEGNVSISVASLRNANANHASMSHLYYQDMNAIYNAMLDYDSSGLSFFYETFDSIRAFNALDEIAFSQVLVSAIQSLPYFLVLDKGCSDNYTDDFTRNYLANCNTECCIGYENFGVRSPVEFLSDLKGDCDTRALLLYQVLKHYNYSVALLTSNYYKHAMIAVSYSEPVDPSKTGISIGNEKFYMWETTSANQNFGELSSNFNNLSFWDISLLHKKTTYEIDSKPL